jgi:hypothetical protein
VSTPSVIAMIGLARLRVASIPIERSQRGAGHSAYSTKLRLRLAWRMVRCVIEFRLGLADRAIGVTIGALSAASIVRDSTGTAAVPPHETRL